MNRSSSKYPARSEIDPAKVPAELQRKHRGKLVGLCCAGCPVAWDKLSDEEKDAKLLAVTPSAPK